MYILYTKTLIFAKKVHTFKRLGTALPDIYLLFWTYQLLYSEIMVDAPLGSVCSYSMVFHINRVPYIYHFCSRIPMVFCININIKVNEVIVIIFVKNKSYIVTALQMNIYILICSCMHTDIAYYHKLCHYTDNRIVLRVIVWELGFFEYCLN